MNSYYATKRDQSHTFNKDGKRLFITRLRIEDLPVVQVKTFEKDKYTALQVAIGSKTKDSKPVTGHTKVINKVPRYLREIRVEEVGEIKAGDVLKITETFEVGDIVKITGVSKGKGFAGGMKRHGFRGGPRTHGQSDRERAPGAIGQGTSPGRIWKGKRMAGRMGNEAIAVLGSQVVKIDTKLGEMWVTGTVPGGKNTLVSITKMRDGKFVGLLEEEKHIEEAPKETEVEQATDVVEDTVEASSKQAETETHEEKKAE